ncbi:membrane protein insertion efficiency factor YidD [Paraburkholderia sp. BL6669N2]|uniref:membrane protein insertion efficiency factor YidD n=1 Tax=Paraburkholderia sp. BL6669N2 TaxID=1938807 RepID=UPI001C6E5CE4|nr:membrane protein insertion efficiency factor YidD [Paraburkholderia sp. BL6669N2]
MILTRLLLWQIVKYRRGHIGAGLRASAQCIYTPSCSKYAFQAIRRHGLMRGGKLAVGRVCRCRPSHYEGGADPVPKKNR